MRHGLHRFSSASDQAPGRIHFNSRHFQSASPFILRSNNGSQIFGIGEDMSLKAGLIGDSASSKWRSDQRAAFLV